MKMLAGKAPEVGKAFDQDGLHAVSRAPMESAFIAVSADMALKQTVSCISKSSGGTVGIANEEGSGERWALTVHLRAAVTTAFKSLCGLETLDNVPNNLCSSKIKADLSNFQRLHKR